MSRILYVDDHPPARMLMRAIIAEMTTDELVLAEDGATAQQATEQSQPDIYILDLDLPDVDGLTLARRLYAIHPAPIILVSAYAEAIKEDEIAGISAFYLAKPLDPDDLANILQRALAGR